MIPLASVGPGFRAALIVAMAITVLSACAALAILISLGGLGRLAGADLLAAPAWLWYFRADPEVARWTRIGVLSSALVPLMLAGAIVLRIGRPLHGAARWAREDELRRAGLRSRQGVVLGERAGRLLTLGGPEHVMLYAPTRTGKGVGVVIPNLLTWSQSLVVLDVKHENWAASAGFRALHGQSVFLFDPLASDGATARYNPLGHIGRKDPVAIFDELQKIAGMLFPVSDHADPFWSEAARTGLIGVGAYVAESPDLPFTLGEIFRQLTQEDPRQRFPALIAERERSGEALSQGCASALTDFCSASEKTFASIRQTITARMGLWLNPRVDWATSASDFDLRTLRTQATSLYLGVSPDNLSRVAPLYNLLLQQFIDLNTRTLPTPDDERSILVVLDEFARLGHAAMIAHGFSFVAGYGIRLLAVLQSPAQLRAEYGPDLAEEIMSNCGAEVLFTPRDIRTAQTLSERLGYLGHESASRSRPAGLGGGSRSVTVSDQRRALMLPQELLALPPHALIVLRSGAPPVLGRKLRYFKSPAFTHRVSPPPRPGPASFSMDDLAPAQTSRPASQAEMMAWAEAQLERTVKPKHGRASPSAERQADASDLPGHGQDDR